MTPPSIFTKNNTLSWSSSQSPRSRGDYLESSDNVSSWLGVTCDKPGQGWYIQGEDSNGHRFKKDLVCGKEWCAVCGADGSTAHSRRWLRWVYKVMQFTTMGYFVFTIPEGIRDRYRTKKSLTRLGKQVQELLKSYGYFRGLRRWHWFGDKSIKWHPHLNVLVDGAYIPPDKLDKIKAAYAAILGVDIADVNYRYRKTPGRIIHTLKYVTRATFHDWGWDVVMATELHGIRNMVVWGRGYWKDWLDSDGVRHLDKEDKEWSLDDLEQTERGEDMEDLQAIEKLSKGVCPICGEPIKWGKAISKSRDKEVPLKDYGAGYYRLPDIVPRKEWLKRKGSCRVD